MKNTKCKINKIKFLCSTLGAMLLTGCSNSAASIGVIGGADGPTAIYIAEKTDTFDRIVTIAVILLAAAVIIYLIKRKK